MFKDIHFKDAGCKYLGRNGMFNCLGVEVHQRQPGGTVMLTIINSRGIGRGFIELPVAAVRQILQAIDENDRTAQE